MLHLKNSNRPVSVLMQDEISEYIAFNTFSKGNRRYLNVSDMKITCYGLFVKSFTTKV